MPFKPQQMPEKPVVEISVTKNNILEYFLPERERKQPATFPCTQVPRLLAGSGSAVNTTREI